MGPSLFSDGWLILAEPLTLFWGDRAAETLLFSMSWSVFERLREFLGRVDARMKAGEHLAASMVAC